jgi:hypothetical protein
MPTSTPTDITSVSRQIAALEASRRLELPGGNSVEIRRLSWLQFEQLWADLAGLLAALLDEAQGEEAVAQRLLSAPALVLRLSSLSSGIADSELAAWPYDELLSLAAAALHFNFIETAGLRDFFAALLAAGSVLAQAEAAAPPLAKPR